MAGDGVSVKVSTNDRSDARATSGIAGMNGDNSVWGLRSGDWVVNVPTSGSGLSVQGGAGSGMSWLLMAGAGVALWFILRGKR